MIQSSNQTHLIPEIGQRWERGEKSMQIVDISETRVWMLCRNFLDSGEEFTFFLRDKWAEVAQKTMAIKGTKFIPANGKLTSLPG